jgi:hypothetical protein
VSTEDAKSQTNNLLANSQRSSSVLEDISDLDNLLLQAYLELTLRLLTSISYLSSGAARLRALLKAVILFVAEYGSTP